MMRGSSFLKSEVGATGNSVFGAVEMLDFGAVGKSLLAKAELTFSFDKPRSALAEVFVSVLTGLADADGEVPRTLLIMSCALAE